MARMRGFLWLLAGLVVALVAGVIAFQTLNRVAESPTLADDPVGVQVEIVVAARALPRRSLLAREDLVVQRVPVAVAPEGALRSQDAALGRLTLVDLVPGEPLLATRLLDPNVQSADGRSALFMVEDEVLMAVPASDRLTRLPFLKPGDQVDLLFSLDVSMDRPPGAPNLDGIDDELITFIALQNVTIAALPGQGEGGLETTGQEPSPPRAVLLTVLPQDAVLVKYLLDAGGILDLVLRAPGTERPFDIDPVDLDYVIDRFDLPYPVGR